VETSIGTDILIAWFFNSADGFFRIFHIYLDIHLIGCRRVVRIMACDIRLLGRLVRYAAPVEDEQ